MIVIKSEELKDTAVHPKLESLMHDLYLKIPSLTFEAGSRDFFFSSDTRFISAVKVHNGHWHVGAISIEEFRDKERNWAGKYYITSPKITVKRGRRNTKHTTLPAEAFKLAKNVFAAVPSQAEIRSEMCEFVSRELNSVHYNAKRNFERKGEDHVAQMMRALMEYRTTGVLTVSAEVDRMLSQPDLHKLSNTAAIATSVAQDFRDKRGTVVREEKDGSLTAIHVDEKQNMQVMNYASSYDMPELQSTKMTMLKLLEVKQPAESIGVRFQINNSNWYFICDGDIITTS